MHSFTAVVEKCHETGLFVGFVPGFPGAHTQGESLDELQANLREVVSMLLEDGNRGIALVKAIDRNSSFFLEIRGRGDVSFSWVLRDTLVRKILGCYYVLEPSAAGNPQQVLPPPSTSSFLRVRECFFFFELFLDISPGVEYLAGAE